MILNDGKEKYEDTTGARPRYGRVQSAFDRTLGLVRRTYTFVAHQSLCASVLASLLSLSSLSTFRVFIWGFWRTAR